MTSPSRHSEHDDGFGGIVRRVLQHGPTPEERLEELLAERRRELEETAARFDASIADLERREELLRDSRASVERLLRLGKTDLDARENELAELLRELTEREALVAQSEEELARRRQELGAVELLRASVERRERDLAARETRLAEIESEPRAPSGPNSTEPVELVFVPGAAYRLVELSLSEAAPGAVVELEGESFVVSKVGPCPLPGDKRRCAFLLASGGPSR